MNINSGSNPLTTTEIHKMSASVNLRIMVGNLGGAPEGRETKSGPVCEFSVAQNDTWNDKDGIKQERTEWTSVTAWGKLGENCVKYLSKGRQVYVEGRCQTDYWEKDGHKFQKTICVARDVKFLGGRDDGKSVNESGNNNEDSF